MTEQTGFHEPDQSQGILDLGPIPARVYEPIELVHKPTRIETIHWVSPEADEACKAFAGDGPEGLCALLIPPDVPRDIADIADTLGAVLWVQNRRVWVPFSLGDWIIREPNGFGVYPCSDPLMDDLYEPPPWS